VNSIKLHIMKQQYSPLHLFSLTFTKSNSGQIWIKPKNVNIPNNSNQNCTICCHMLRSNGRHTTL